jgi:hypothetical protein
LHYFWAVSGAIELLADGFCNGIICMRDVSGQFPCVFFFWIPNSIHQVDNLAANALAVQNFVDFIFVIALDV